MNSIKHACEIVGGQASLARMLSVTPPTVNQWVSGERQVPTDRCAAIEKATNGKVTRRELRPDNWHLIWPELVTKEFPAPTKESSRQAA